MLCASSLAMKLGRTSALFTSNARASKSFSKMFMRDLLKRHFQIPSMHGSVRAYAAHNKMNLVRQPARTHIRLRASVTVAQKLNAFYFFFFRCLQRSLVRSLRRLGERLQWRTFHGRVRSIFILSGNLSLPSHTKRAHGSPRARCARIYGDPDFIAFNFSGATECSTKCSRPVGPFNCFDVASFYWIQSR